jgi:hypothetical protein
MSLWPLFGGLLILFVHVSLSIKRKRPASLMSICATVLEELSRGGVHS